MIKIEKNLTAIPDSIQLPFIENFSGNNVPRAPETTHQRRLEVIRNKKYHDIDKYNNRYKQPDTKEALIILYKKKCAFCENKTIQPHVEHYRPKDKYYWLAYSWDNLLLACPACNLAKGKKFELQGSFSDFVNNEQNLKEIHGSSAKLDRIERPKMVNPEVTDPLGNIKFEKNGLIKSDDIRFAYTIKELKIADKPLNDERKSLLDKFRKYIRAALVDNSTVEEQTIAIKTVIKNFVIDATCDDSTFIAFRKYAISNKWLNEIIKEMKN